MLATDAGRHQWQASTPRSQAVGRAVVTATPLHRARALGWAAPRLAFRWVTTGERWSRRPRVVRLGPLVLPMVSGAAEARGAITTGWSCRTRRTRTTPQEP